jgi:hypothetical protein
MRCSLARQQRRLKQIINPFNPWNQGTWIITKTASRSRRIHTINRPVSDLRELFRFPFITNNYSCTLQYIHTDDGEMTNSKKRSALPSGTAAASKRAKTKNGVQKFYAVRVGRKPGVYMNWDDCQGQIAGHKGATCEYLIHSSVTRKSPSLAWATLVFTQLTAT